MFAASKALEIGLLGRCSPSVKSPNSISISFEMKFLQNKFNYHDQIQHETSISFHLYLGVSFHCTHVHVVFSALLPSPGLDPYLPICTLYTLGPAVPLSPLLFTSLSFLLTCSHLADMAGMECISKSGQLGNSRNSEQHFDLLRFVIFIFPPIFGTFSHSKVSYLTPVTPGVSYQNIWGKSGPPSLRAGVGYSEHWQ